MRSVTQTGHVATVDLGVSFLQGPAVDTTLARLDQVVSTVTAVPGVTSVRLLINGGTPLGLFPGIDATVPLTRAALATPDVAGHRARHASRRAGERGDSARSSSSSPRSATCCRQASTASPGRRRRPRWSRSRSGRACRGRASQTRARARRSRPPSGRRRSRRAPPAGASRCSIDRQLVLAIEDDRVVRTLDVSTGKPSTPTPIGCSRSTRKFARWWSMPFRDWLLWAAPFVGGVATHQYPDVPPYAASHGCVRVPPVERALALRLPLRGHAGQRDRELDVRRARSSPARRCSPCSGRAAPRAPPTRRRRSARRPHRRPQHADAGFQVGAVRGHGVMFARGLEIDLASALAARLGIPRVVFYQEPRSRA